MDESQVRALIDAGELEAHGIGKRGIRVYVDSIRTYQERYARRPKREPGKKIAIVRARRQSAATAHQRAMNELRREGIIP
jgi:hypothetical protein